MAGMFDDLIPPTASGKAAPAVHPFFADLIPTTQPDGAPIGLANVPTAKSDPIYHGAVPVTQAPDQGAGLAFASGVGGVPVVGPTIQGGLQRVAAAARSAMSGDGYAAELERVRDMTDAARQQHPAAAFAGDLTGAAAALAPAVAAAPAAFGAEGGALTAGQVARGAGSGLILGGADGAARTGTVSGAALGAVGGALGGAVGPPIAAGLGNVARTGMDALARTANPVRGVPQPVVDSLTRTLANDGTLGAAGAANMAAAGPHAMLADASPGFASALDGALSHGGPGTSAARDAITARTVASGADLNATLDRTLGPEQGVTTTTDALRTNSAAARQQAYDIAYNQPIDYTSDHGRALEAMVANRVPPSIVARANAMMRTEGAPSRQMMMRPDGSLEVMPDVRQIDYITRSLNDVARAGDGQGALGGNTAEGRAYGGLARELRDTLRNAVPEYGTALDTAAQPIQERNALDFGANLLRSTTPRDVAQATIADMTAPELAYARSGVRAHIGETLANVKRTLADPSVDARGVGQIVKDLSSPAAQEKMSLLLNPADQRAFADHLDWAGNALNLRGAIAANSRTAPRQSINAAIDQAAQPGLLSKMLLAGGPIKATRPIAEIVTGNTPADVAARGDAIAGGLAQALTTQGPTAGSMLQQLIAAHGAREAAAAAAEALPYGATTSTGALALLPAVNARSPY